MFKKIYSLHVAIFAFCVIFSVQSMEEELVISKNGWNDDSICFSALSLVDDSDDEKKSSNIEETSVLGFESGLFSALDPAFTEDMKEFCIIKKENFNEKEVSAKEAKQTMIIEENYHNPSSVREIVLEEEDVVDEADWYSWTQNVTLQTGKYWDSVKKVTANAYSKLLDMPQQH